MLKSLQLFGFKSFADRTQFDFSNGITCVVGPNGSGKSNVVDGIKWLLGDQSPKSLRGKEMTDVIFNGALGRKPSAFAEAVLTFDNSKQTLSVDTPEVQIGRRLWQTGESEYLINGATCRLKDVKDLFLGTGAGASAYSIIEQGRVEQILQANASTRRVVFEEAAGISRYKLRKVETLRKLERIGQNVLRLTDIVDEVDTQLNAAKTQATKALKYREVEIELRELWLGLAADDARTLSAKLSKVQQGLQSDETELEQLNARRQASEQQLTLLDQQISELDDRLLAIERGHSQTGQAITREQSTIQHLQTRSQELDADITRLRTQRSRLHHRTREIDILAATTSSALAESQQSITTRKAEVERYELQVAEHNSLIESTRQHCDTLKEQHTAAVQEQHERQHRVTGLNAQIVALRESELRAATELERCNDELERARAAFDLQIEIVEERQKQSEAVEAELTTVRQQHRQLSQDYELSQKRSSELREERSALQARKVILEDWERRQEGRGLGVKEILSRSKTAAAPPWNQLLGSIADLLVVDLDHAALLEVALGDRAQLLVMHEFSSLIDYLNHNVATINGRVGFVSLADLSDDKNSSAANIDLSAYPGVKHRADELVMDNLDPTVELTDDLRKLITALLGNTWIVEKLDVALELAQTEGKSCRFVTLQGERLEADGTLFVGLDRPESAIVSRKSELRRLRNELIRVDAAMSEQHKCLAELVETLTMIDAEAGELHQRWQKENDHFLEAKAQATEHEQKIVRLEQERHRWESESDELASRLERFQLQQAEAQSRLTKLGAEIEATQKQLSQHTERVTAVETQVEEIEQQLQIARVALAKHEERLSALEQEQSRHAEEQRQRQQQYQESERRLEATRDKLRQYSLQILNSRACLAELYLDSDLSERDVLSIHGEKKQLRQIRAKLQKEDNQVQQERRELQDTKHTREMQSRDIQYQITTLKQRIEEEYQLTLEDIVGTGASALALYKAGRIKGLSKPSQHHTTDDQDESIESFDSSEQVVETAEEVPEETGEIVDSLSGEEEGESSEVDLSTEHTDESVLTNVEFDAVEFEEIRDVVDGYVQRLRRKLKMMGNVNPDSLQNLDELDKRYGQLKAQLDDLVAAQATLDEIIRRLNIESKRIFLDTFETIRGHFKELFRKLFGGGEADIILEDPEDVLDCGIDIVARPPGKELRSITLMSGGEKTMTAVALLMSIFRSKPSPFCILDEVDAALDEANVERYVSVLKEFDTATQFILITHNKRSMSAGSVLHGVTMEQSGISKRFSVRFEDVNENSDFKKPSEDQNQAA
ncbi:MAG: chromosome segregation protein SMC [Planctomycetota bacterium]|nr:chromosome segregation protein SMC [Planctomycetota bacterium]